jgi:hypothetical protein
MPAKVNTPIELAAVAAGRDHIKTAAFARVFNVTSKRVRRRYCMTGCCYGVRPVKFGRDLLWPVAEVAVIASVLAAFSRW